ncbi:DUF4124 domain-containing protein [Pseudoduganella plicata]|uniref:DUF4124 domain-containing protein n=1 Tax=Pseudoduganella plicata TaxID=321984 RepID=A0A4P7BAI2_9BURK|nr:DUF4124 domain-containing protein [Pseudoduganella plicata]QBQ35110.1 DUF4124 domain-containing protein [Pseudoduganella plicata]GGZ10334.1 hypothetical protein GCM10007388_49810 [Pseudoduganella plicata]
MRLAALLLAGCAVTAHAQVYKCTVDGKVTYSQAPCERGNETVLTVPGAPAATRDDPRELERMRRAGAQLEKERVARAAAQERIDARADRAAATRRQRCDKLRLQARWMDEDARRAQPQAQEAARLKARRAADRAALECAA